MKQNWAITREQEVQSWEYAKKFKKILCDYRQNCLFVVKYNKVVKIITDTSNCAFVFVNNKMYGFEIYVR